MIFPPSATPACLPTCLPPCLPARPPAQVAAHGEHHLCVRKGVAPDGRVVTQFEVLQTRPERLQEISAMLGLPEAAAEELLQAAAPPAQAAAEAAAEAALQ